MSVPHVHTGLTLKQRHKIQVSLMPQLVYDCFIKVIDIEKAELSLKAHDRVYDVIHFCFVD